MQALSSLDLLNVWERGRTQPPEHRALQLLAAAWPEASPEALAALGLGQRDARLLALREGIFGPRLTSVTACPACGERLELAFDVADVLVAPPGDDPPTGEAPFTLDADGCEVQFRVPNSQDLAVINPEDSATTNRRALLTRCILEAKLDGEEMPVAALSEAVIDAVAAQIADVDPQATVDLDLTCPACGHRWLAAFDISTFFWTEIETWARRLLTDVHRLALAYGWREADILAMTPWRRRAYLEMISYG